MENAPFILIALACPVGMVLMMVLMGRGMMGMGKGKHHEEAQAPLDTLPADPEKRLAVLQAQRQLLDTQIDAIDQHENRASKTQEAG